MNENQKKKRSKEKKRKNEICCTEMLSESTNVNQLIFFCLRILPFLSCILIELEVCPFY